MTSYYENEQEFNKRGIDYDLADCLEYNDIRIKVEDIKKVHAVWEGERDGENWRWVVALKDGRSGLLEGGCDYIGWDCQSWAGFTPAKTVRAAAILEANKIVRAALLSQLKSARAKTKN